MKEITKFLVPALLFIWELPQNLMGMLVFGVMKISRKIVLVEPDSYRYFIETSNTGVSLGLFVFWTPSGNRFEHNVNDCRMHEYGHSKQSVMLGPFYLLFVGIPSLSRVLYSKWYRKKHGHKWANYFNGFPENWADILGGVILPEK
jgi:hypothetical protein